MECSLCGKEIENYRDEFNHLIIDENHAADICPDCVDKFTKWQIAILSKLFPTKALKKRFEGKK